MPGNQNVVIADTPHHHCVESLRDSRFGNMRARFALVAERGGGVDGDDVRAFRATAINTDSYARRPWQPRDLREESVRIRPV
jgi:hypothetical protein